MSFTFNNGENHIFGTRSGGNEVITLKAAYGQQLAIEGSTITPVGITTQSIQVTDTTDSVSTATGSIVTAGGIGMAKKLTALNGEFTATTASTSTTTGSLVNDGGFGNAGALYTDTLRVVNSTDSTTLTTGSLQTLGGLGVSKQITALNAKLTATTASTSTTTGSLVNDGGFGNSGAIYTDSINAVSGATSKNFVEVPESTVTSGSITTLTVASSGIQVFTGSTFHYVRLPVVSTLTLGRVFRIINQSSGGVVDVQSSNGASLVTVPIGYSVEVACILLTGTTPSSWTYSPLRTSSGSTTSIPATTASSSTTTGSLINSGGMGNSGALYTDTLRVVNTTDSTTLTTGSLQTLGGLGVSKQITALNAKLTGTTASSSTTTGSLINGGGMGNSGAIYTDTLRVVNTTDATTITTGSMQTLGGIGCSKRVFTTDLTVSNSIIGKSIYCTLVKALDTTVPTGTFVNTLASGATFTNTTGGFSHSSGVITFSESGNYVIQARVVGLGVANSAYIFIYKNSTEIATSILFPIITTHTHFNQFAVNTFNAGDTCKFEVAHTYGSNINFYGNSLLIYKIVA